MQKEIVAISGRRLKILPLNRPAAIE
jgi:hypothetical protein